jgi:Copper binding proteins, plastocyanin/azurin family
MSILTLSSRPRALLIPLLVLSVCGAIAFALQAAGGPEPRQVTLLARGMSFYLPGDPTPNPRLVVERGEEVRLVLRNEDRGIPHDLEVPAGGGERKATREVRGLGDTASLAFRAPETAGDYEYVCTLHSRMMRGVLEVR